MLVGVVVKPQGTRGQVKIKPETDDPERFLGLKTLYVLKEGQYQAVPFENVSVRERMVYCTLNGASTRDEAEAQRSLNLYVSRQDAVPLPEDRFFIADIIGCKVQDTAGKELGILTDVLQPGSADVYVIKASAGSILLPALKKVVLDIKPLEKLIIVNEAMLPEVAVFED